MRLSGAVVASALAATLPALAAPPSSVPVVRVPETYEGAVAGAAMPARDLDRWWIAFGDPRLDALEAEAFERGSDAKTAAARLDEARATRAAQTAATWPGGSISGDASRQRTYSIGAPANDLNPTGGTTDSAQGAFNVSWELDLFGRLKVARRIARADAAEARFIVEGALASLAASVADTYFRAQGLAIQGTDARETVRIQTELLEIARRKVAAGAAPADEVDRVEGDLAQARAKATDLDAQRDTARRQLLILVGRNLESLNDFTLGGDPPPPPASPMAIPSELLSRRPDIREAEARLQSEIGTARLAHLAIFPTITLLPGLGLASTATPGVSYIPPSTLVSTQQTTTTGFWSLAANVTAPTLDIPKLLQRAKAEDARSRQTAIAYEKIVRTAFGDAQNALSELAAGRTATAQLAEGEGRANRAFMAARKRYAQGLGDLTAVLAAEQSWRSIHADLTSERIDTLRRAVRTYKALGGGWAAASPQGAS